MSAEVEGLQSPFAVFDKSYRGHAKPRPPTEASTVSSQTAEISRSQSAGDSKQSERPQTSSRKSSPSRGRPRTRGSSPRSPKVRSADSRQSIDTLKTATLAKLPSLRLSTSRTSVSPKPLHIAGYKPPAGSTVVDDETSVQAEEILQNEEELLALVNNDVFQFACKGSGVDIDDLLPKTMNDFRPHPAISVERAKVDLEQYNTMRHQYLCLVLMNLEDAAEQLAERTYKQEQLADNTWVGFESALQRERERLNRIRRNRERIETVQLRENDKIKESRKRFEARQKEFAQRQKEAEEQKRLEEEKMKDRAQQRQKQLDKVRRTKEQRERERVQHIIRKEREKEEAKEAARQALLQEQAEKERVRAARRKARDAKRDQVKQRDELKKQQLLKQMAEKEQKLQRVREEKERELNRKKDERYVKSKIRAKNAERVRKEREFKYKQMMEKMRESYEKMEHLKDMREAVQEERRRQKALEIIRIDKWKAETKLEKDISPGPGEYAVPSTLTPAGGTWGKHKPKSELEWQMLRSSVIPGPGQYKPKPQEIIRGGTWGAYSPKSDIEWKMYHAAQIPGPADYKPPVEVSPNKGVAFSTTNTPTAIEEIMRKKAREPGPTDYAVTNIGKEKMTLSKLKKKVQTANNKLKLFTKLGGITRSLMADAQNHFPVSPIRRPQSAVTPTGTPLTADQRNGQDGDVPSHFHHGMRPATVESSAVSPKTQKEQGGEAPQPPSKHTMPTIESARSLPDESAGEEENGLNSEDRDHDQCSTPPFGHHEDDGKGKGKGNDDKKSDQTKGSGYEEPAPDVHHDHKQEMVGDSFNDNGQQHPTESKDSVANEVNRENAAEENEASEQNVVAAE